MEQIHDFSRQDVDFAFEIGLKPEFEVDATKINVIKYNVIVTDEMVNEEIERLQTRNGNMTEPETASSEDHVLNVTFTELDAAGNMVEGGINKANSLLVKYFLCVPLCTSMLGCLLP